MEPKGFAEPCLRNTDLKEHYHLKSEGVEIFESFIKLRSTHISVRDCHGNRIDMSFMGVLCMESTGCAVEHRTRS